MERSMFYAVCNTFSQAMGSDTLIPVKSMDRSIDLRPLNVVVKKKKRQFLFIKKSYYMPYDFQLQDLLEDPQNPLDVSIQTFDFCEFNPTSKYSLSGKLGVEILKDLADTKLSASDSVLISSPLGIIEKRDVKSGMLLRGLSERKINFNHPFVQQVRERSDDVLCIVQGVCQVQKVAEIKRVDNVGGSLDVKGDLMIPTYNVKGQISSEVTNEKKQDVVVPAGTPIAYTVVELKVDTANGYMEPQVVKGCEGGFVKNELSGKLLTMGVSDEETEGFLAHNVEELKRMTKILTPIKETDTSKKSQLRTLLAEILAHPADIGILADLLEVADDKLIAPEKTMKLSCFTSNPRKFADLLRILGFHVGESLFVYDGKVTPLLTAVGYMFDALDEVSYSTLQLLRECLQNEPKNIKQLAELCGKALVSKKPTKLTITLPPESAAFRLAAHLDFTIQNGVAFPPRILHQFTDEVYCVLFPFSDN